MTVRTNKQAIYAAIQDDATKEALTKANLIPISEDVSKTFLEDNSVEKPELRGTFGANDSVIISQTQAVTIPSFIQGGGIVDKKKTPKAPPVAPLLKACFHEEEFRNASNAKEANADDQRVVRYAPMDNEVFGATIRYQIDDIKQEMVSAKGTMSLSIEVGSFASMTFEMQSPYGTAPSKDAAKDISGTIPPFQQTLAVSGQTTLSVPGLPDAFSNCVRSFSLTQGVTISAIDCATREGGNAIKYIQTGREATGEIVFDVSEDKIAELVKVWGGLKAIKDSEPFKIASNKVTKALILLGERKADNSDYVYKGNTFAVASANYKIGAPTLGDSDGIATWTFPITFIPDGTNPDYELYYIGDLSS